MSDSNAYQENSGLERWRLHVVRHAYETNLRKLEQLKKDAHRKSENWFLTYEDRAKNEFSPLLLESALSNARYWAAFEDGVTRSISVLKGMG